MNEDSVAATEASQGLLVDLESPAFRSSDYVSLMERIRANEDKLSDLKPLASHGGIHKTLERVRKYYYWPSLVKDVKVHVLACETKAAIKIQRPPMGVPAESQRFFQKLYIDFLAVKKLTADVVIKYLQEDLFLTFGVPETIISDNGSQFKAEIFQKFLRVNKILHTLTAVYSPQANA
ncbi:uncharacterized protein K02A2.6-like [Drosophila rhopaloa]|uniref:RNA-directed DNA polymerase n=1 Tax=Drosophila rhopaloa TaxID=1041015 RepID=A0ABM5J2L6_DRORH|nr:uncharacterized protein K02A2.6-like [Drosophila rhopaloa]